MVRKGEIRYADIRFNKTIPKADNAPGMLGNVLEWCGDMNYIDLGFRIKVGDTIVLRDRQARLMRGGGFAL